ncbi:class I adenylate-forming enzyme family protein, partial [Paraburkholderia tropica]|uniref:class I adenylate-forming enzyme family protein n=1 Tax=Paraburkholderia tropica TaxID=92647 RepID=UPI002AB5F220
MHTSVEGLVTSAAQTFADKVAIYDNGKPYSFIDIEILSDAIATALSKRGIEPGSVVSICAPNSVEWITCYYGILKAGCIVNPLNSMLSPPELKYALSDCKSSLLFAPLSKLVSLRGEQPDTSATLVSLDEEYEGIESYAQLTLELGRSQQVSRNQPCSHETLAQISTISYTSGTTGKPKGALLSHRAILINVTMTATMHGRKRDDIVVSALPFSHVYGNVVMQTTFACGLTLVIHPTFQVETILQSIQAHKATVFEGVPTMYLYLLNHPQFDACDLSSIRFCTVGGQTMPLAKMKEVESRFDAPLLELWGMTELGGLGTTHALLGERRLGSIGVALPYVQTRIVSISDYKKTMPVGEIGELVVKGPITMEGYLNRPDETLKSIDADGYLHTGDLGYVDA